MWTFFLYSIGFLFLFQPSYLAAAGTGFVQDSVWFSETTIIAGTTVLVYEAVSNNTSTSIDVTVQFEDKHIVLGKRQVLVPAGAVREVSIIWIPTPGTHEIVARILSDSVTYDGRTETIPVKVLVSQNINDTSNKPLPENATEILASVDSLQQKLNSVLPGSVTGWITNVYARIESFRISTATFLNEQKIDEEALLQAELSDTIDTTTEIDLENESASQLSDLDTTTNPFDTVFLHGKIYGYSILSQFFYQKVLFYIASGSILFLIIRMLVRRMH